jgi:hypothetical protein
VIAVADDDDRSVLCHRLWARALAQQEQQSPQQQELASPLLRSAGVEEEEEEETAGAKPPSSSQQHQEQEQEQEHPHEYYKKPFFGPWRFGRGGTGGGGGGGGSSKGERGSGVGRLGTSGDYATFKVSRSNRQEGDWSPLCVLLCSYHAPSRTHPFTSTHPCTDWAISFSHTNPTRTRTLTMC